MKRWASIVPLAVLVAAAAWGTRAAAAVPTFADSVAEFSGVQGQHNWSYGYYDRGADGNGVYNAGPDFTPMVQFNHPAHPGRWSADGAQFWTSVGASLMVPNGTTTSSIGGVLHPAEHWPVRRWTSTVDGPIHIGGRVRKSVASPASNGLYARIFVDGVEVYNRFVGGQEVTYHSFIVDAVVSVGSTVDFVVDPYQANDHDDGTDFEVTITQGVTLRWGVQFAGSISGDDIPYDMAVDRHGNVYVAGETWGGPDHLQDMLLVKFNEYGTKLWERVYQGPGGGPDKAYSLALDAAGNAYVTGLSYAIGTGIDYATVKFSPSGSQLWAQRASGPGAAYDEAGHVAIGPDGGIYVTGYSHGGSTGFDWLTVKYAPDGTPVWSDRWNGPANGADYVRSMAFAPDGQLWVSGRTLQSGPDYDLTTIRYTVEGVRSSPIFYNSGFNDNDEPEAIAVDRDSNAYIAGWSDTNTGQSLLVIKYDASGVQQWVQHWDRPGGIYLDQGRAIAVDNLGRVFVAAASQRAEPSGPGLIEYALLRFDAATGVQYPREEFYSAPGGSHSSPVAIALDQTGGVHVTGFSHGGPGTLNDFATLQYSSDLELLWAKRFDSPAHNDDEPTCLLVEGLWVYVAGLSKGMSSGTVDMQVLKYAQAQEAAEVPEAFAGVVSRSGFRKHLRTGRYVQTVTIGVAPGVFTPPHLVLDDLPPGVTLANATGVTQMRYPLGSPYRTGTQNAPGSTLWTAILEFQNPANVPITYRTRVLVRWQP